MKSYSYNIKSSQPLEISGKRERKQTDRLSTESPFVKEKEKITHEGRGTELGAIPYIEHQLSVKSYNLRITQSFK